jgi:hypothetical protein
MTLSEVASRSSLPCRPWTDGDGRGLVQPTDPHRVLLRDQVRGFELPAGLFTVLELDQKVVVRMLVTPQLGYLDGAGTLELLQSLAETLASRGWIRIQERGRTYLVARLPRAVEERVGLWRHGSWVAELRVRRAIEAGTPQARMLDCKGNAYLVTFVLWDEKKIDRLGKTG